MSDQVTKTPLRIRTFAGDLESVKQKRSQPQSEKKSSSTPTVPTAAQPDTAPTKHDAAPTLKAATAFPKVAHIPEKKPSEKDHSNMQTPTLKEATAFPPIAHTSETKKDKQTTPDTNIDVASEKPHKDGTPIPAFHELQKKVTEINHEQDTHKEVAPVHKKTIKSATAPRANIGYDSTIITDTISDRFQLFPSIIKAIKDWFRKLQVNRRHKKIPTYTIPETERRKGVIQKATTKTGTIFTADNETIKERIRRRQRAENTNEEDESETTWSPYTDTGYNLLEAPDDEPVVQNVTVAYRKIPRFVTPPKVAPEPLPIDVVDKPPVIKETHHIPPPEVITPAASPVADVIEPIESTWGSVQTEESIPPVSDAVADMDQQPAAEQTPEFVTDPETERVPESEEAPEVESETVTHNATNTLSLMTLASIVGVILLFFGVRTIISYISEHRAETEPIVVAHTFAQSDINPIVVTPADVKDFREILLTTTESGPAGVTEMPVLAPDNTELSPSYIFSLLNFRTTPHFTQSLTNVRFVTVNHNQPALVLRFTDTDEVRGGLLQWEPMMIKDFASLYDITEDKILPFTDEAIDDYDVRILKIDDVVVLVYSVINDSTAIIAHTKADFSQIVQQGIVE